MAKSEKNGKKKPNRSGVPLSCYIDVELRNAMDEYIAKFNETAEHKASVRSTVQSALRAYLKAKGHLSR